MGADSGKLLGEVKSIRFYRYRMTSSNGNIFRITGPLCGEFPGHRGIPRSPVNSPHKGQWRGALMFSLICAWIDGWVNNGEAGDLRPHRAHYDVTVMIFRSGKHLNFCSGKNKLEIRDSKIVYSKVTRLFGVTVLYKLHNNNDAYQNIITWSGNYLTRCLLVVPHVATELGQHWSR